MAAPGWTWHSPTRRGRMQPPGFPFRIHVPTGRAQTQVWPEPGAGRVWYQLLAQDTPAGGFWRAHAFRASAADATLFVGEQSRPVPTLPDAEAELAGLRTLVDANDPAGRGAHELLGYYGVPH
jgi:hypothetical protein